MIRYYFLVAVRNVLRNHGFALLNIIGFALGLAAFLLITFFVFDELSYDRFNENHQRIFRVDTELKYGGVVSSFSIAAPPVAAAMVTSFPEVERTVRITPVQNLRFRKENEIIREDRVMYTDESLFDIFSFHLLQGNYRNSLSNPESIVITASVAQKYFKTDDVVGRTMVLQNDTSLHVITAVISDMPEQSHFHADIFLPLESQPNSHGTRFNQFTFTTYALLRDRQVASDLTSRLSAFLNAHLSSDMNVEAFEKGGNYIRLVLTPLDDIHLRSNKQRELEANSDITYIYILSAVAFLILILACINFTNLFTARSANRGREVGIRKVLGSLRTGIMLQFLMESFVMTGISVFLALIISMIFLPAFNALSGKHLEVTWNTLPIVILSVLFITILVAVMAGVYPAFYLSAFKPAKVLRGRLAVGFKGSSLRNMLVVIQFSIATFLIVSTLVILHQLEFIRSKSLGFNREQILVIKNAGSMDDPEVLKEEVKRLSGVMNASLSGYLPTGGVRW
jgi:putative ABC transport system permease protein